MWGFGIFFAVKMMNKVIQLCHPIPLRPYRCSKNTVLWLYSQGRENRNGGIILKLLQFVPKFYAFLFDSQNIMWKVGKPQSKRLWLYADQRPPNILSVSISDPTRDKILFLPWFFCRTRESRSRANALPRTGYRPYHTAKTTVSSRQIFWMKIRFCRSLVQTS